MFMTKDGINSVLGPKGVSCRDRTLLRTEFGSSGPNPLILGSLVCSILKFRSFVYSLHCFLCLFLTFPKLFRPALGFPSDFILNPSQS